jgi:outer membrane lipoprotein-sorting protein
MILRHLHRSALILLLVLPLTGCLLRSRKVEHQIVPQPLKTATQQELINYIDAQAAKVQSMQATVDIDTEVGGSQQGKITDYKEIRGYILARKPAMLRMIGLYPIVRTQAFDMVSDGAQFKLWIPGKNRFVTGRNDIPAPNPQQPLENLRPQIIYDALLIPAVDPQNQIAVMESGYETVLDSRRHRVQIPDYEVVIIQRNGKGWILARRIIFSRTDLLPHRHLVYDDQGNVVTAAQYEGYKDYDGTNFPSQIDISRPQEEYDITLKMVKLQINQPLPDDKFVLQQPPGAQVVRLDQPHASQIGANGTDPK